MSTFIPRCEAPCHYRFSHESYLCYHNELWWIAGTSTDSLFLCDGLVFDLCRGSSVSRLGECADRGFHCLDAAQHAHLNGQSDDYYASYRSVDAYLRGDFDGDEDERVDYSLQNYWNESLLWDIHAEIDALSGMGFAEPSNVFEIVDDEPVVAPQPTPVAEPTRWSVGVFYITKQRDRFVVRHAHGGLVPVGNGTHAASVSFASLEAALSRASETMSRYLSGMAA